MKFFSKKKKLKILLSKDIEKIEESMPFNSVFVPYRYLNRFSR